MKGILFSLVSIAALALAACASPAGVGATRPITTDQAATIAVATLQAPADHPPATLTPEAPTELLPRPLYYLGADGYSPITQIYRLERDGKTKTELTLEPDGVVGYDISPVDGSIAFIANNQLLLAEADGSNRRVMVDGGSARRQDDPRFFQDPLSHPVFSPDGQTIAYAHRHKGLTLHSIASGVSSVVIHDDEYTGNSPVSYSPDGTNLLVALGQWEAPPASAVYYPETGNLVRIESGQEVDLSCCNEHGEPVWSPDGSSFYGVAIPLTFCCQTGELWKVDTGTGAVTRSLQISFEPGGTFYLPKELYPSPDGRLYFFFGAYQHDLGFLDAPVLNMVSSAADEVTDQTILRNENFLLMMEALWASDASFVIVAAAPSRNWNEAGGVLELYPTDGQKEAVWLAPFGTQMKWGPWK